MNKNRIHWIDVAKGLMIIGMVLNHIANYGHRMGVDLYTFPWNFTIGHAYGVFTMQSFFILSGYTLNCNQDVWTFLKKQIKSLLIPYFSFTIVFSLLALIAWGDSLIIDCYGERWSFLVESYWFLTALFVAKVAVFFLHKLTKNNNLMVLGGGILFVIAGIAISEYYSGTPEPSHWHNWFHYRNGLCMAVFLTIGSYLKKYQIVERYGIKIGIGYCVLYCITYLMLLLGVPGSQYLAAPNYTHYLDPNLNNVNGFLLIPSYLFYCTAGSIMVFRIAQKIKNSKMFEYFGRTSLIIYCVHFTFLKLSIDILSDYMSVSGIFTSGVFWGIVAIVTLTASALMAMLFERKPFNYLIGKF